MIPKRRRILRTIKLTEISGVDRPCQQGALVTIMKRDDAQDLPKVEPSRIRKLRTQASGLQILQDMQDISKQLGEMADGLEPPSPIARADKALEKFWSRQAREAAEEARRHGGSGSVAKPKHGILRTIGRVALSFLGANSHARHARSHRFKRADEALARAKGE